MIKFKKNLIMILVTLAVSIVMLVGCSQKENVNTKPTNGTTNQETNTSYSAEYLTDIEIFKKEMLDNNIVILDARGEDSYKKGHIKGAIPITWQPFTKQDVKPGDKGWGVVLPKDELAKKLGELGINKDKKVIVYGNKDGWGEDGRIVWMLRMAGINSTMLNGGIELWESQKNEITKDSTNITPVECKIDSYDLSMNITTEELKKNYDKITIIDARAKDEYEGATKFGEARGGHLPKAINLTFSNVYNQDGTIKKIEELQKMFEEKGLKKDSEIVTYCTGGIRSAHLALVLKMSGYDKVKNYDASYYEWAGDKSNTVEK